MKRTAKLVLPVVAMLAAAAQAAELRELRGRVVDEHDQPAASVDVTYYWLANGPFWDRDGKMIDLANEAVQKEVYGPNRIGQMEPGVREVVKTDREGRFSIKIHDIYHTLFAMDASRSRGGLGVVLKADPSAPIEIRLVPLVRVHGSFEGPTKGIRPSWTNVYFHVPEDPARPLDMTRIAMCASNEARFLLSLPPGRYVIKAYNQDHDAAIYGKEIVLADEVPEVDLGMVLLPPDKSPPSRIKQSKQKGTFGDYTKHYGAKPPAWHVNDARGMSRNVQVTDFKGKWVLLDFWSLNCQPCLKRTLPELMKFYEAHKGQRDRFEILAFYLNPEGDFDSMADLDRALQPIIEHVWNGKTIPFPILLDNTFKTWESFGLRGLPTVLLIDPDGNLVEGDQSVLAEKLGK